MEGPIITCMSIGVYAHALTRGNKYIVKKKMGTSIELLETMEKQFGYQKLILLKEI